MAVVIPYLRIFIIAFVLTVFILSLRYNSSQVAQQLQKFTDSSSSSYSANKTIKILIWTSYWRSNALWHKILSELVNKRCPYTNCQLTLSHSELSSSDAVLFHIVDVFLEKFKIQATRNPSQIWIGLTYEPPFILENSGVSLQKLNGLFNRTMSYRTDGDIVARHGTFLKISGNSILPSYTSNWVNSHETTKERNYAAGKRHLVAWFASADSKGKCDSQSGREVYVKELQKHVKVDIYGSCGSFKCGGKKNMRNSYKVEEDDCFMMVSQDYKFVLAFENTLCQDYVTEKLFNHLKLNVIPVVFGANNYSAVAPPKSVIDASDFEPEDLAKYLKLLDKNDSLYNEYFEWKKDYLVVSHDGVPLACDLCAKLNNPEWKTERKVYDDFDKWFTKGCTKGFDNDKPKINLVN